MYRKSAQKESPKFQNISRKRLFLYQCILVSLPFLVLFILEVYLHLFSIVDEAPNSYVNVSPFSIFTREKINGKEFARITHRFAYAERNIQFTVRKPENTIRIFLLGGSACAGWPHKDRETFSTYLRQNLDTFTLISLSGLPMREYLRAIHSHSSTMT